MDKTKNLSLFSLALLLGLIQSIAGLTDKESFLNCKTTNKNSPLDINLPMKYANFNLQMSFNSVRNLEFRKHENNQIGFIADWGEITYQSQKYSVERLDVVSPSLHMIQGIRYPMEVQIRAKEKYGGIITVAFIFDKFADQKNEFLERLGVGKDQYPKSLFFIEQKKPQYLDGVFNLQQLVGEQDKFLMYEGESPTGGCEPSIVFVSHHLNWISEDQYEDIRDSTILAITKARRPGQQIYQNISPQIDNPPVPLDSPVKRPKTPSTALFAPFVYSPANIHSLGWIPPTEVPGWLKVSSKQIVNKVKMPILPSTMKYLPYYYEKLSIDNLLKPVFVIVPSNLFFTTNVQPNSIPVYIRTNFTQSNGVRDLVQIKMPVRYDPNEKPTKKNPHAHKKTEKHRLNLNAHAPEHFKFRRICKDWQMGVILNRYFKNKESWNFVDKKSGITPASLLQCKEWKVIRINNLGQEVDDKGVAMETPTQKASCRTYISVILNKVTHKGLQDYVSKACGPFAYLKRAPFDSSGWVIPPNIPQSQIAKAEDLTN